MNNPDTDPGDASVPSETDAKRYDDPRDAEVARILDEVLNSWSDREVDEQGNISYSPANEQERRQGRALLQEARRLGPRDDELRADLAGLIDVVLYHEPKGSRFLRTVRNVAIAVVGLLFLHFLLSSTTPVNRELVAGLDGLVAWLPMGRDMQDATGNVADIRIHGVSGTADLLTGSSHAAARLAGRGGRIEVPLDISPSAMPVVTLAAWVKPSTHGGETQQMIFAHGTYTCRSLSTTHLRDNLKDLRATLHAATGNGETPPLPIPTDFTTFVAVTYDHPNEEVTVHVGERSVTVSATPGMGRDYLVIGNTPGKRNGFVGIVDEVLILNRHLTPSEIAAFAGRQPYRDPREATRRVRLRVTAPQTTVRSAMGSEFEELAIVPRATLLVRLGNDRIWLVAEQRSYNKVRLEDGRDGFVLAEDVDIVPAERTASERFVRTYMNWGNPLFWAFLGVFAISASLFYFFYRRLDTIFVRLSRRIVRPGNPWPITSSVCFGSLCALPMLLSQDQMDAFLDAPVFWPAGHGPLTWIYWVLLVLYCAIMVGIAIESVSRFGPQVGLLRAILLIVVANLLMFAALVLTLVLFIVFLLFAFAFALFSSLFQTRYVIKDRYGSVISRGVE